MNAIYVGRVHHARPASEKSGQHKLSYRVFMLALELNDIPVLSRRLRLFSHNRLNLLALFDRDYADRTGAPIRPQIEAKLREASIGWDGGSITLLTMPRLLNYVFNPLSVYFCYRKNGTLAALMHEVSNTFGERHFYVLPAREEAGAITQTCDKEFFVSPFLEMDLRYEFRVTPPCERAAVAMAVKRGDKIALTASFSGERRDLTDANLLRAWASHPLMTFKVIAGIHWEAVKMWLKGVRYLGRTAGVQPPSIRRDDSTPTRSSSLRSHP